MLISIIIPLYDCEQFIEETIFSVLEQSHKDFELIVVDDGSKDRSAELVQAIQDKRLRYIYQKNAGVSVARNHGFKESKGDYVAFLDSDDVLEEDCLKLKLALFHKNEDLGLVHGNMAVINEKSEPLGEIYVGKEGWILDDLLKWRETCIPSPSSILVKREVVEEVGGFDKDLSTAADQEFFFRIAAKYEVGKVNKVLGWYRIHANNMHNNINVMETDHTLAFQKAKAYGLFQNKRFERQCFANLYKIIGASYWKNQNEKLKGMKFLIRAFYTDPFQFFNLF